MERSAKPTAPLSKYEAHPFEPSPNATASERCTLCGESRNQIRHHPTRIAAARLLRGSEREAGEP